MNETNSTREAGGGGENQELLQRLASEEAKRRESALERISERELNDATVLHRVEFLAAQDPMTYVRVAARSKLQEFGHLAAGLQIPRLSPDYRAPDQGFLSRIQLVSVASLLMILAMAVYVVSCTLPVFINSNHTGWVALGLGWVTFGSQQYAWFANFLLWAAWVFILGRYWRGAILVAFLAFLLSLDTFRMWEIPEGDSTRPVEGFAIGTYVWIGSIVITLIAALYGYLKFRNDSPIEKASLQQDETSAELS